MVELPSDLVALPTSPWDERPAELKLDVQEVRTALWLNKGNIANTAKVLKVDSGRLRRFVNNSIYLTSEMQEAKEVIKDKAEAVVVEALEDAQDPGRRDSMARFVLSSIGKDRGYGSGAGVGVSVNGPKGRMTITWDDGSSVVGDNSNESPKTIEGEVKVS